MQVLFSALSLNDL